MSDLIISNSLVAPLPLPKVDVVIRAGTMDDLSFIDSLQKMHTKQVGWMPTKTWEGKIRLGHVLVAEAVGGGSGVGGGDETIRPTTHDFRPTTHDFRPAPAGYLIGNDQYFKRDDVGIIYQMNVLPGRQRGLIGASLLKAQFERSAYGCKLYCCWCAQDIEANRFWEAMGFVPLAFRAGSEKKARVHIFWQKRIRSGDVTTPWWFPSKTAGGAIREDRIVLPIPQDTHWSDAKPMILPSAERTEVKVLSTEKKTRKPRSPLSTQSSALSTPPPARRNGLLFDIPQQNEPLPEAQPAKLSKPKAEKVKRVCDPQLVSAARELRDRWLERVNASPMIGHAKYDVTRAIEGDVRIDVIPADTHRVNTRRVKLLAA